MYDLYESWSKASGRDFIAFWRGAGIEDEEILALLPNVTRSEVCPPLTVLLLTFAIFFFKALIEYINLRMFHVFFGGENNHVRERLKLTFSHVDAGV